MKKDWEIDCFFLLILAKAKNSSGVVDGYFTQDELDKLEKKLKETIEWRDQAVKDQEAQPMHEMPKMTTSLIAEKALDMDREVKYMYNKVKIGKAAKDRKMEEEAKKKEKEEKKKAKKEAKKEAAENETEGKQKFKKSPNFFPISNFYFMPNFQFFYFLPILVFSTNVQFFTDFKFLSIFFLPNFKFPPIFNFSLIFNSTRIFYFF